MSGVQVLALGAVLGVLAGQLGELVVIAVAARLRSNRGRHRSEVTR